MAKYENSELTFHQHTKIITIYSVIIYGNNLSIGRKYFPQLKILTLWITTNCGKNLKRWEYQATWPASWEICMQVMKQQLELYMEQQTGSK